MECMSTAQQLVGEGGMVGQRDEEARKTVELGESQRDRRTKSSLRIMATVHGQIGKTRPIKLLYFIKHFRAFQSHTATTSRQAFRARMCARKCALNLPREAQAGARNLPSWFCPLRKIQVQELQDGVR